MRDTSLRDDLTGQQRQTVRPQARIILRFPKLGGQVSAEEGGLRE